jgi:hypothetical protein
MEENDEARFNHETGEEARYWFCVSEFVDLSFEHGLDKMLKEVIHLREYKSKGMVR